MAATAGNGLRRVRTRFASDWGTNGPSHMGLPQRVWLRAACPGTPGTWETNAGRELIAYTATSPECRI